MPADIQNSYGHWFDGPSALWAKKMRVLLLTHGTRGDVQPFVALAKALQQAGHEPTLAAPNSSAFLAEEHGVRLRRVHDTWNTLTRDPIVRAAFETNYRGLRGKKLALQTMRKFRPLMAKVLQDMAEAAREAADLVVCHPSGPLHLVGEQLRVPAIPVCLEPIWFPTNSFTNPILPYQLPRPLNRPSYVATRLWIRGFVGKTTEWRNTTLGLPDRRGYSNPLRNPDGTPATVLNAFSRHILPADIDYPDLIHTTGFWYLPPTSDWSPPAHLSDFLAYEGPTVYVGFGSLAHLAPTQVDELIIEATRLAGVRAVALSAGRNGHQNGSGHVLFVDQVPFDWLFPRMSAIVHHGGCGTCGAAMAAGRPQIVCPAESPQRFYGRRMHNSGVAYRPISQPDLTAQSLAKAIRRTVTDRTLAQRAEELGRQVRAEQGAEAAVKILETIT